MIACSKRSSAFAGCSRRRRLRPGGAAPCNLSAIVRGLASVNHRNQEGLVKRINLRPRHRGLVAVPALVCAVGLSACGGFDSAASGDHLIKDYVKKFGQGKVDVKS